MLVQLTNILLFVQADQDAVPNHVAADADSQLLYYAVMAHKQCVHRAVLAVAAYVTEWVDAHVQVFANPAKVVAPEAVKAKGIFTTVRYRNQINRVISVIIKAGNICQCL